MKITSITVKKIKTHPIAKSSMATYLRHSLPRLYAQILKQTQFLNKFIDENHRISIYERLHCIEHNLSDRPKCQHCKENYVVRFIKEKECYAKWCSPKCQASDPECIMKSKATRKERYDDENFTNETKRKRTIKKKSDEDPHYWEKRVKKTKATKLKNHGSESWNNSEKMKQTIRNHASEDPDFWQKREQKSMKTKVKNGHDPKWNNREKAKQTCMSNYGVEQFFASDEWQEMCKHMLEDDPQYYKRRSEKRLETIASIPDFYEIRQQKTDLTCLDRYGVRSSFQLEKCRENRILADMTKKMQYLIDCEYDKPMFGVDELEMHYADKNYKYKFKCKKCGKIFYAALKWFFAKHYHCSKCYPRDRSICQRQIYEYVMSIWKDKDKVLFNDRTLICPYELDIAVIDGSMRLAIEYDGLFWHSIDNVPHRNQKQIDKDYHLKKLEMCISNNVQLVHIFEDEWLVDQNEIKMMLMYKLGLSQSLHDIKYYAEVEDRKISLHDITNKREVASMSFSKSRFNIKEEWEILSFKPAVKDSLNSLLTEFEKTAKPKSIVYFADRRKDYSKEFIDNGFRVDKVIGPQCWWVNKKMQRYHDKHFKKSIASEVLGEKFTNSDEQLSKLKSMRWMRIYDCGMLKLVKHLA